jgi:hypothetical protein
MMSAAPVLPELADLTDQLAAQLRETAEGLRGQSDALRAAVEQTSGRSRRALDDAVAAGFRAGRAAALTDDAERWSGLGYALRHGWTVRDADPEDAGAAIRTKQSD